MNEPLGYEVPALALVVVSAIVTTTSIPAASWRTSFSDPCHLATLSAIAVVAALFVTRSLGDRGLRLERWMLALFLACMPLVYVASWFSSPSPDAGWLCVELVGVPVYGLLAVLGLRRAPWLLAAGIAAHGVCWDAWHYGRTPFVPNWYAMGCLVMDVTLALYVAARVGRWVRLRAPVLAAE